jgi:cell division protein FtsB
VHRIIIFFLANFADLGSGKSCEFLFLNINILILHFASMQSEIDGPSETDLLKQCISELKAENDKIKAENTELKARIAKLEDKQLQNELIKNLLSVSCDKNR